MTKEVVDPAEELLLRFGGSLVEQLGAQLYPSATATVAEMISNSWDADARNVWITIPFGESWRSESEITILDDGHGMTRTQARDAYLIVGRKRRLENLGEYSEGGRKVHGRKGIGKLAAFGTAGILDCVTRRDGVTTSFRLDYDKIRKLKPTANYPVEAVSGSTILRNPETEEALSHGTLIRLTRLLLKRALSEEQFMVSMARRFALATDEMRVWINNKPLSRFAIDVEFRFPHDSAPEGVDVHDDWGVELVDDQPVQWWIGFTEHPLEEESQQGVSIIANGKMAQRPFKFERGQGTEGQLGQEYLVGEVVADWIDIGRDIEDDLIQSNRDQLQLEDQRLQPLLAWGRKRLTWALRVRNQLRSEKTLRKFESSVAVEEILKPYTRTEQRQLLRVAQTVSRLPEMDAPGVERLMRDIVNSREDVAVRQLMESIADEAEPVQERMWSLVREFGLIDARRTLTLVEARLSTIRRLKESVVSGAREIPNIHEIIKGDAWLLDPRWHLLGDEVDIATLDIDYDPERDASSGRFLDFLFALGPRTPAPFDEVIVIEIKRGYYDDGRIRRATEAELEKFVSYVLAAKEHYASNTVPPRIRGLMVAEGYARRADVRRKFYEQSSDPKVEFKTWERVIDETERMHTGWLAVSQKRAAG